jgi:MYXO-CTERM domain-containing protein
MDCQINCQSGGFVKCETDLQGGCETACSQPKGALFCDGQYVDVGDQLDKCVADMQALLQIKVTGYAYGDASCGDGGCQAEGHAGVSCAQAAVGNDSPGSAVAFLGAIAAFGLAISRRKNQRA